MIFCLAALGSCTRFGFEHHTVTDSRPDSEIYDGATSDTHDGATSDTHDGATSDTHDGATSDTHDAATSDTSGDLLMDDGGCDGSTAVTLMISPINLEDRWVERGTKRFYRVAIALVGGCKVPSLKYSSGQSWISATHFTHPSPRIMTFEIGVDATSLATGSHLGKVTVSSNSPTIPVIPVTVTLNIRVVDLKQVHVGMNATGCPHAGIGSSVTTTCDFVGADGLQKAVAALKGRAHIHLHDDGGQTATYLGNVELKGQTWLSAAERSDPTKVLIIWPYPGQASREGVLRLVEDDIQVSRLTVIARPGCDFGLTTWLSQTDPTSATGKHLIQNVFFYSLAPEVLGHNTIEAPVQIGSETTVRNCLFRGFFELNIKLDGMHDTRLIQNTFISYQNIPDPITIAKSHDLTIANNIFVTNTRIRDHLITADASTTRLILVGNVVEGFSKIVDGLTTTTNVVKDNIVGKAELASPLHPLFLANATQHASTLVPGEGKSLDGLLVVDIPLRVPGALQKRSARTTRQMLVRVGPGTCGNHPCDLTLAADNEIQQAVWSVWKGGTVEVYPSPKAYAGNTVISWGVTLRGMGSLPQDVTLASHEELVPFSYGLWNHRAVIAVLYAIDLPVTIENLTVEVISAADARDHGVWFEPKSSGNNASYHQLRRVIVLSHDTSAGLFDAIIVGNKALVQDVLVHGPFGTCVRFGSRYQTNEHTPITSNARVVNLTCRLTSMGTHTPRAAFEVASVKDVALINIAVELSETAPLFRAQRRSVGDTAALAVDPPTSFSIHAASIRNASPNFDGFTSASGNYTLTSVDTVGSGAPFFVSATNSHLATGAAAIDRGIDPSTIDSALHAGTALGGVSRQGKRIDRGAYEQGN